MANIDIEKKDKNSNRIWLLALLLLIAVLAAVFWPREEAGINDEEIAMTEEMAATDDNIATDDRIGSNIAPAPEVVSYKEWAANMDQKEMGLGHEFTKNGLMNMADALAAVAERAPNVNRTQFDSKLATMRNKANAITNNWESTTHANKIKDAFQAGVSVFEEIQSTSFTDMNQEVNQLKQTVGAMDTQTLTLDQKNNVKEVFREAAEVLTRMDQNINR